MVYEGALGVLCAGDSSMSTDSFQVAMATWASRTLPARLDVPQTARVLGFAEHDIQILMVARKLTPLGDPAPKAPKWFAAVEILQLAVDVDWLHKATKEVSKYWRHKRERRGNPPRASQRSLRATAQSAPQKVSPDSSPKPSPSQHSTSTGEAAHSNEQADEKAA